MKRLLTAFAVLVALLVVAPWGIGKLAERHVNRSLERLVDEAPYLSIVDRRYRSGWFRSEQEVTFELLGDWAPAINTALEAADKGAASAPVEQAVAADEAQAIPKFKPPRFTVRNEILHGPVLWPFGLGAARVNTRIVWDVKLRHEFFKVFGDDQPFRMSTRVGFLGGGSTTIFSEARALQPEDGSELSWDKFEFTVDFSADWSRMSLKGGWPRLEVRSPEGAQFAMRGLKAEGSARRIVGEVYDTDARVTIESLRLADTDTGVMEATGLEYAVDTQDRGEFVDLSLRIGAGPTRLRELALQEVHYDFSLRRLHSASLDKLLVAIKESYSRPSQGLSEIDFGMIEAYRKHGLALLAHDPELVIDRISLATKSGDGTIKGVIRFRGVTEADFETGALPLLGKVEVDVDVDIAEALLVELGGGAGIGMATDGGYAERRDGRLISKIEYRAGGLRINGKTPGIPGVSGPSQGMGPGGKAEERPPQ